jgi:hypothetical protein
MLKAWHTHGNTPQGGADFYPLLAQRGKGPTGGNL